MKPAIEVNGIGKKYLINHKNKASYSTLKDDLANIIKRPLGLANMVDGKEETFWALKDVSFDVPKGEIFGVIGKNGSGKSTLLKILSRIVSPTEGDIVLRGRTASLLEVGTGFHPELTGRENVYFNGSMLGMSRKEISKKFNEIVEFSEIEKFIDTPVKFYSSGMYVRLAFSVAAHLDPDILILDEVLSVGDADFQKKSMQKIRSTMEKGTTVLFVSHSTTLVQQICTKAVLLNKGKVEAIGSVKEVIEKYTGEPLKDPGKLEYFFGREGKRNIAIKNIDVTNKSNSSETKQRLVHDIYVDIELEKPTEFNNLKIDFNILNSSGDWLAHCTNKELTKSKTKSKTIKIKIPQIPLAPGVYKANISLFKNSILEDFIPQAITFNIKNSDKLDEGVVEVLDLVSHIIEPDA